jgi:hypothetical protein
MSGCDPQRVGEVDESGVEKAHRAQCLAERLVASRRGGVGS